MNDWAYTTGTVIGTAILGTPVWAPAIAVWVSVRRKRAAQRRRIEQCWSHTQSMPVLFYGGQDPSRDLCPECQVRFRRVEAAEARRAEYDAWWERVLEWRGALV